jgi:hypothetical protein
MNFKEYFRIEEGVSWYQEALLQQIFQDTEVKHDTQVRVEIQHFLQEDPCKIDTQVYSVFHEAFELWYLPMLCFDEKKSGTWFLTLQQSAQREYSCGDELGNFLQLWIVILHEMHVIFVFEVQEFDSTSAENILKGYNKIQNKKNITRKIVTKR